MNGMKSRIRGLFSHCGKDVDAIVIANSSMPNLDMNFFYLTNLVDSGVFEHSYAVAFPDGHAVVVTSILEQAIALQGRHEVQAFAGKAEREKILMKLLSVKKLGFNGDITQNQFRYLSSLTKAAMTDCSKAFTAARSVKDAEEIKLILEACRISSKAGNEIQQFIKEGMTEKALAAKLIELQYAYGATNLAFTPIVAFGKNSAEPHHFPSDRKLKKNEFIVLDFGAEYRKYASDISRTFVFGKADKRMREMYETVQKAQRESAAMVKAGMNGKDIDRYARDIVDRKFKGAFIHSLGHSVGLAVHDGDALYHAVDLPLKENMVVTIEPGIYLKEIGGVRIEDTLVVTRGKPEILTTPSKELLEIS